MNAIDATKIISSRKRILGPGSYDLKVTSIGWNSERGSYILNLNGMTQYHYDQALALFDDGTEESFQKATNQHLTANARLGVDYLPVAKEVVKVMIEEVTTNNGVTGLFVTSVSEIKSKQASTVDFAAMLASRSVVLEQEEVA